MSRISIQLTDKLLPETEYNIDERVFSSFLERVGGMGCYQRMLVIILSLVQFLCGGIFLLAPYIFYQEPYHCSQGTEGLTCHEYVCSLPPTERIAFIPEASLKSIASQYGDFRCSTEKLGIDMYISLMLFGKIGGAIVMALIGNRLSRKGLMLLSQVTMALGLAIAMTGHSLLVIGMGLFITLSGVQNCFYLTFAILTEQVSESHRGYFSVVIQMMFGFGVLMNVFWASWLQQWKIILFACYFIPILVILVATYIFVIDTPMDLITRSCPSSALIAFEQIARINGRYSNHTITLMEIYDIKNKYQKKMEKDRTDSPHFTFKDLFNYSSLKTITLALIFLHVCTSLSFFGPALILDKFQLSIYVNGLVIGFSEILAYPLCMSLIDKSKRQMVAYVCYSVAAFTALLMTFVWNQAQGQASSNNYLLLILLFTFRFAISVEYTILMVYLNELYPTQVRVLGLTCFSFVGGISMTLIPELADLCIQNGIPIMGCLTVLLGLCVYTSSQLPETLGTMPQDEIYELRSNPVKIEMKVLGSVDSANSKDTSDQ